VTSESIEAAIKELVLVYGDGVRLAREGARSLVRLDAVQLYETCRPPVTRMLLVFDPGQPKPQFYVVPDQLLTNGKAPKNQATTIVGGESWMGCSFNIPWKEGDTIIRFVAAARQRFSQPE